MSLNLIRVSSVHSSRNRVGSTWNFASRRTKYQDLQPCYLDSHTVISLSETCKESDPRNNFSSFP